MREYYSFLYLDKKSIENLYPQIFGDTVEKTIARSKEWEVESKIEAGIPKALDANIRGDKSALFSENIKTAKNNAVKAQELINWVRREENIKDIQYIQDIIESNKNKNSFPFVGKAVFMLSDVSGIEKNIFLKDRTSIDGRLSFNINDNAVFVLESGRTNFVDRNISEYQDTEVYSLNRNCRYGIIMFVPKIYMEKEIYSLFTFFRMGEVTRLNVYGQAIKCSEYFYKIDPYAIWT